MDKEQKGRMKSSISWVGGRYRGEIKDNVPHGWGMLTLPNGTKYEGEWIWGKPQGSGRIKFPDGAVYEGELYRGKRHGYGKYYKPGGSVVTGLWENGSMAKLLAEEEEISPAWSRSSERVAINIDNLTFKYRSGKGVFDLDFAVGKGEVFGFLGPNGAGKTTTIRNLLGFVKPKQGRCSVVGLDCWKDASRIQKQLGYLPGEMAFFEEMTGTQFLNLLDAMRGGRKKMYRSVLMERFELDTSTRIRRMSKGTKQKLGIVAAFMHDPAVYILDEPTSGLDPLMQNIFVELIREERERGKTILMSSHNFEETYRTCDRAGIIREGRLVAVQDVHSLKSSQRKAYLVTLGSPSDLDHLRSAGLELGRINNNTVEVFVSGNYDQFIKALAGCRVLGLDVVNQTLEQVFMKYYGREADVE